MDEDNLQRYVNEIRRRELRFLEGYPSTLFILARFLLKHDQRLPLTAVFTSSETLHTIQRKAIESAFECDIFDFYGLAERVIFAGECEEHDGKHLAQKYGITEVVDADGNSVQPGTYGYLVGTSLHNEAMPLIRYRTSDVSAIRGGNCNCGRSQPRIEDVSTKAEDIVVTPEGRMISPSILTHPFKPFDQIRKSQLIQDRLDHVLVRLVPNDEFSPEEEIRLRAKLQERLGASIHIDIQYEEDIQRGPSGKFRWVVSEVDHDVQISWLNEEAADSDPIQSSAAR